MAEAWLAPVDVRLLRALEREPNLVRAARELGIGRDRAFYRLRRLAVLYGQPVARGRRGGPTPGATRLTPLGRRLLDRATGAPPHPGAHVWTGTYRASPSPRVELGPTATLEVAFRGRDGSPTTVEVNPEAFVVARHRAVLSARNALAATVRRVAARRDGTALLEADWQGRTVRVAITAGSVARLGLVRGARVYLYVKATAIHRVRTRSPGRLRS